ncbi:hypothetical protein TWF718_001377 [Orbilia javanica]|uniref:SH3 domain-containing protein n=1 Tax=Orbilia javanica TaxID=47235 RepID=A0AAN8N8L8_9PEZI
MNVAQEQIHDQHDLMTVNSRINGGDVNGEPYIPDSISPYNHDPHYANGHDDDMNDEDELDEDMLDRMSSSPSISDEDIDFEFVYALHTFIATVEGQANATKGDTMVLLDDSNSYWWLVRVVKDSSIGYLPAEHIETPSERLARLNKHRNVDLSTPMLGDNQEKSKNMFKKAIRRRAAKTVQFAPPTYCEAPNYSSSEEEDEDGEYYSNDDEGAAMDEDAEQDDSKPNGGSTRDDDEITLVDTAEAVERPIVLEEKPKDKKDEKPSAPQQQQQQPASKPLTKPENRGGDEILESKVDGSSEPKSKPAPLRNTDSVLFGDPDSEPRRITLTPKLARDDDITSPPGVVPVKPKTSFDRIGKREEALSPPPTGKNEKSKKEKKSILGSLFKKRKNNSKDEEIEEFLHSNEKKSNESLRDDSSSGRPGSSRGGNSFEQSSPQLQQQQNARAQQQQQNEKLLQNPSSQQPKKGPEVTSKLIKTPIRKIESVREVDEEEEEQPFGMRFATRILPMDKQQSTVIPAPAEMLSRQEQEATAPTSTAQQTAAVEASPVSIQTSISTSGPATEEPTPVIAQTDAVDGRADGGSEDNNPHDASPTEATYPDTPVAQPGSPGELAWSEAALRTYLDDDNQDIRDFLVVVRHRTEVSTVKSHPQITPLFADANSKLQDMNMRLDSILERYMKSRR